MNDYEVIRRVLETEKTRYLTELSQYVFEVDRRANKMQIKQAVEKIYDVKVQSVNVLNLPAKATKRTGRRRVTRRPAWKKAVVTLFPGQRIEVFEGM